jgi:hypothetical protein
MNNKRKMKKKITPTIANIDKNVRKKESSYTAGGNVR